MLYYPQLAAGAVACYPLSKAIVRRTVVNRMGDGSSLKFSDPDAQEVRWELRYTGLSDMERATLESFFLSCEGRLRTFTFFDPAGNLLRHSDDLSQWQIDGLMRIDSGSTLTNTAQVWQGIAQTIDGPEWFVWCFSAAVRGEGSVRMRIGALESEYRVRSEQEDVWCAGASEGDAEEITCRLDVEPGRTVEVSRLLLQAQPMPGAHRRTSGTSGVYTETRFDHDRIVFSADGPDNHSTVVHLVSPVRG